MGAIGKLDFRDKRVLFAFDCDHTIVDVDSDVEVTRLGKQPLPDSITSLHDGHYWTPYMNAVFQHLHSQGLDLETISSTFKQLPLVNGMRQLLQFIHSPTTEGPNNDWELLVVSDANDFGIRNILSNIIPKGFSSIPLITNWTKLEEEDGWLRILPFHAQFECPFCPQNLCKGAALSNYIKEKGPFHHVVYVGDGKNDICPAMRLAKTDYVWARRDFQLHKIIEAKERNGVEIRLKATVHLWSNGEDILEALKKL